MPVIFIVPRKVIGIPAIAWRYLIDSASASPGLNEFRIFDASLTNIAPSGTPTVTSVLSGDIPSWGAPNLIDQPTGYPDTSGNGNMWVGTGAAAGQSATITFGTSQAVTRVEVFNTGFVQGGVTTDFRIQYSTNGVDFIDIITKTGLTLSDWNTGNNGTLPECVACLAWRFNF